MRPFAINTAVAIACAAGLCVASAAVAQQSNQPAGNQPGNQPAGNQPGAAQQEQVVSDPARARLLEAQQAIKNAETVSYKLACTITMMMGGTMEVEAEVDMMRKDETRQWLVRREGAAEVPGMGETEFTVVNDGGYVTYIDHDSKRVREEIARTTRKHRSLTLADSAWLETLTATEPYAELLSKGESFTLEEGAERLDGVMCDKITVSMGENRGEELWWFGADDKLPRKHVLDVAAGMNRTFELKEVRKDHALNESVFEIETPEGYEFVTSRRAEAAPGEFTQQTRTPTRPKAPDFTLTSAEGEEISLSGLRDRVVLLNFWASWSSASKEALDDVQAIHEQYAGQPVTVLSLTWRERSADAAAEEVNGRGHSYTLLTEADDVARAFGAKGFPTFYVIAKDGSIVETVAEYDPETTRPALTSAIDRALSGEADATITIAPGNQTGGNQSGDNQPAGNRPGNQPGGNGNGNGNDDNG